MNLLPSNRYATYLLIGLFLLIVASLALRIKVEATHYTSDDSIFYIGAADYIRNGADITKVELGLPFKKEDWKIYMAIWPSGYPLLIALIGEIFNTSSLVASKLVNLLFLGFVFLLFHKWFGEIAWFPALYFCSFNMLEVYSYTWSEGPFLFFIFYLCFLLEQDHDHAKEPYLYLKLFLCLTSLFLLRYAGILFFPLVGVYLLKHLIKRETIISWHYLIGLFLSSSIVLAYLLFNKLNTGFYTGAERVYINLETATYFIINLSQGIFNEFAIARNYFFKGYTDYLFLLLLMIQLLLIFYIFYEANRSESTQRIMLWESPMLQVALFYLIFIIILRKISPFESFNYRILAPFSAPVFVYLLRMLIRDTSNQFCKKVYPWIAAFFLLSLLMNLPKVYILDKISG